MSTPELSFEFFPPRTSVGSDKLRQVHAELNKFAPSFCSVTYGAGGSTQEGTFDAVKMMRDERVDFEFPASDTVGQFFHVISGRTSSCFVCQVFVVRIDGAEGKIRGAMATND